MRNLLILMLACCCIFTGCNKTSSDKEIKIGAILELTGSVPAVGASSKNAAEMAVQEINDKGGIVIDGKQMPVNLLIEDNAAQADQSVAAAQKLINQDNVVAIIGPNVSLGAIPAAEVAEHAKTVLITPWSTSPKTTLNAQTGNPKRYVFRACFTDAFEGQILARFAWQDRGYKTAAILYNVASDAPTSQAEAFKQSFTALGGKIVAIETYSTSDQDFSAQLTKIKATNPDVIFLPAYYNSVPLIAQQARRLGITVPFLGSDAWSSPALIKLANGAVEGSYFVNHYSPDAQTPETRTFVDAYVAYYEQKPDDVAALTYDAMQMLFRAIAAAGTLDREAIRRELVKLPPYNGVTATISFRPNSGDPVKGAVIMQIKGNRFVWVENIAAQ